MQRLKASKWNQELFLYSAVKACIFNFHFRWIPWRSFPRPKIQIYKPSNSSSISFCGEREEHPVRRLILWRVKIYFFCSPPYELTWTITNAAIDESLCDTFLDEKPNKQFSFEKQEKKLDGSGVSFSGGSTRTRYFKKITEKIGFSCREICRQTNF